MIGLDGAVAEWLGRGLQSLVHRFDSGPRLYAFPLLSWSGRACEVGH